MARYVSLAASRGRWAGLVASMLMAHAAWAAGPNDARSPANLTPEQIQRERERRLEGIRSGEFPAIARMIRESCAKRDSVGMIAADQANGNLALPDAVDGCLAALDRQAREGALMSLYEDMVRRGAPAPQPRTARELVEWKEDQLLAVSRVISPEARQLPQRIIDAIQAGRGSFEVTGGQTWLITPGLAFDTGYVAAWSEQGKNAPGTVNDQARLRTATEACYSQRGDNRTCFTVGYMQGTAAYTASRRTAAAGGAGSSAR